MTMSNTKIFRAELLDLTFTNHITFQFQLYLVVYFRANVIFFGSVFIVVVVQLCIRSRSVQCDVPTYPCYKTKDWAAVQTAVAFNS